MTDSRDTISAAEPSLHDKLVKPSRTRGYAPKGKDVEPNQAPVGAAGTSTPASDDDRSPDPAPTSRS